MEPFNFGQTLGAYRRIRRITQADLAKAAGLSREAISNLERSKAKPRASTVKTLCAVLDIPIRALDPPAKSVLPGPPVYISPWPPHGITWQEVQVAIGDYVSRRTYEGLTALNTEKGDMEVGGEAAALGQGLDATEVVRKAARQPKPQQHRKAT